MLPQKRKQMTPLKLSAGIQTFEKLRNENCIYVDKTKYFIDLIDNGSAYFLSRPRRFGKSLTISTFDAIFSGKKEMFKGLYAEEFLNRPDFSPFPVIHLDMSVISTDQGIELLEESICNLTKRVAKSLNVKLPDSKIYGDLFSELIYETSQKYNQKVVILIDEYDKPYTDFINDPNMAEIVRKKLRNYYSQIKANEKHIRFIFITGIAKYTKMGVFSTLNNLIDISPMIKYSEICGLTEEEIIKYFSYHLKETSDKFKISTEELIKRMKHYYNGFCFDETGEARLYNPFSTLYFFFSQSFSNYWFESATPSFLSEYIKARKLTIEQFRNFPISKDFIYNSVELEKASPENFLYQSGYLSLRPGTSDYLSLDYPNTEVLNSMSALLTQNILHDNDDNFSYCRNDLIKALTTSNYEKAISAFNRLLASVPYDDFSKAAQQSISNNDYEIKPQEWLYRSTILAFLRGCGVLVFGEMHTSKGRADLIVSHNQNTWVIEIKVAYNGECPKQKAEEALKQIMDKNYAKQFPVALCIGLAIDDEKREITEWAVDKKTF